MAEQEVARLADLPEGGMRAVEAGGQKIVLVRWQGEVHALQGECPHAGAPLAEGAVCNGHLVCPWHMGTFRIADGGLVEPPPMQALRRYPVRVDGDAVLVDLEPLPAAPAAVWRPDDARVMLLLGSGAAAAMAAVTLREAGFGGRVVMVGPAAEEPIDRTLLSKMALAGQWKLEDLPLWDADAVARLGVERIVGAVAAMEAGSGRVRLSDGQAIEYDAALIATGAEPRRLDVPGADLPGVFTLRRRDDLAAILAAAEQGGPAVVLGTSFIGMEAASALRQRGIEVAVAGPETAPFARPFGPAVSDALVGLHRSNGVALHLGRQVARLEGGDAVEAVVLDDGTRLPARLVLLGIGVRPVTGFLRGVELQDDGGVVVDAQLSVAPGVFAAGDVAAFPYRGGRARIEHWRLAQQHGRVAARNMLGQGEAFDRVPFFWTEQHGKVLNYLGHTATWDEIVVDGDVAAFEFVSYYVKSGRVAAVLSCGRDGATALLAELMRREIGVAEARDAVRRLAGRG